MQVMLLGHLTLSDVNILNDLKTRCVTDLSVEADVDK